MKIMIIEDEKIQSTSLKLQLKQLGYSNCIVVDNGVLAHSQLELSDYDLIFCDIRMPHMDGITLLSKFIDKSRVKGVIIMSALEDNILNVTRGVCNLIGYDFVEVLHKPFDIKDVRRVIKKFEDRVTVIDEEIIIDKDEVSQAFENDLVNVLYQPQIDMRIGELVGVEAIASIGHITSSHKSLMSVVQELGLEEELYTRVLSKSTSSIASLQSNFRLSVRVSPTLLEGDLCDLTLAICNQSGFSPSNLVIEISEPDAFSTCASSMSNLARLRLHNIELSIGEFGTGYSSLDKLVDLPFSEIKIDRRFINNVLEDYKLQQITKSSIKLAQSLGLNCVADGVMSEKQCDYLRDIGIDICQGSFTGEAMEMSALLDYISSLNISPKSFQSVDALVVTSESHSSKALSRLIEKEFNGCNVIHSKTLEEAYALPIDSINMIISDDVTYKKMKSILHSDAIRYRGEIVIIDGNDITSSLEVIRTAIIERDKVATKIRNRTSLSKQELEVAKMLCEGHQNKDIAAAMNLSQKTVSTYKMRIMNKLEVKSIIELSKAFELMKK